MTRQQRQIVMLSALLVVILGVILYTYRDALIPRPIGEALGLPPQRQPLPALGDYSELTERADYKRLQRFGDVPVQVRGLGNDNPFEAPRAPR